MINYRQSLGNSLLFNKEFYYSAFKYNLAFSNSRTIYVLNAQIATVQSAFIYHNYCIFAEKDSNIHFSHVDLCISLDVSPAIWYSKGVHVAWRVSNEN